MFNESRITIILPVLIALINIQIISFPISSLITSLFWTTQQFIFIHPFIHSSIHSFIHSFIHSYIHSFAHVYTRNRDFCLRTRVTLLPLDDVNRLNRKNIICRRWWYTEKNTLQERVSLFVLCHPSPLISIHKYQLLKPLVFLTPRVTKVCQFLQATRNCRARQFHSLWKTKLL